MIPRLSYVAQLGMHALARRGKARPVRPYRQGGKVRATARGKAVAFFLHHSELGHQTRSRLSRALGLLEVAGDTFGDADPVALQEPLPLVADRLR